MGAPADLPAPLSGPSLSRRRLLGTGAGLTASALLGARRAGSVAAQSTDAVVPAAAAGTLDEQEIRVLIFSGPEADAHTRIAPSFTEYTQGKIKVVVEEGGRNVDYDTKFLAAMQAQSDAYDVIHSPADRFLLAGPAGFFAPLDPFMEDPELFNAAAYNLEDFPQSLLALYQLDGQQFLLPQEASTLMFYYRKDLLQKYGVPEPPITGYSLDEVRQHAVTIQAALTAEGLTDTYALIFGAKPPFHAGINIIQPAWSKGQEFFTEDLHPQVDQPKMIEATQQMINFLFEDQVVSPGIVGYEYPEVLTAFQQGKAAMALQWNAAAPTILDPEKSPISAPTTGFAAYPYDATAGAGQLRVFPSVHAIGVSAFSKKQRAAFAYVAWFTSQEIARDYVINGGGSSGRASLLNDPAVLAAGPYYSAVLEGFKAYHPLPQITTWGNIYTDIMCAHFAGIWTQQVTVEEGIANMQEEMTTYLEDQGVI